MATVNIVSENNWVLGASSGGAVTLTSYAADSKMVVTNTADVPTFNRHTAGHILPLNENVSITLNAGEFLWLNGNGNITVTAGG